MYVSILLISSWSLRMTFSGMPLLLLPLLLGMTTVFNTVTAQSEYHGVLQVLILKYVWFKTIVSKILASAQFGKIGNRVTLLIYSKSLLLNTSYFYHYMQWPSSFQLKEIWYSSCLSWHLPLAHWTHVHMLFKSCRVTPSKLACDTQWAAHESTFMYWTQAIFRALHTIHTLCSAQ